MISPFHIIFSLSVLFIPELLLAQSDTLVLNEALGNSFEKIYKKNNPTLKYSYNEESQTHNYSGNWDFDGDEKPDSLYFIGNGGAHLYFHLKLVLSIDHNERDYPFLVLDLPYIGDITDLNKSNINAPYPQFVVYDFDADGIAEVYLNFDISFSSIPKKYKKKGLNSRCVLLDYKNGEVVVRNYQN